MGRPFLWDAPRGAPLAANPGGGAGPPLRPPVAGLKSRNRLRRPPLFGLAPGGVCRAAPVAGGAVRSCRTLSPLPGALRGRAVCFLWHFPWGRPRRPLAGTVVPVEPGLSSSPGAEPGPAAVRPPGAAALCAARRPSRQSFPVRPHHAERPPRRGGRVWRRRARRQRAPDASAAGRRRAASAAAGPCGSRWRRGAAAQPRRRRRTARPAAADARARPQPDAVRRQPFPVEQLARILLAVRRRRRCAPPRRAPRSRWRARMSRQRSQTAAICNAGKGR